MARWGSASGGSSTSAGWATTSVAGGGTAAVDGTYEGTTVTLTGSATIAVTLADNGSTIVRVYQGGAGGYTATFSGLTWLTDQPTWSAIAASDWTEIRVFKVGSTMYAEWGYLPDSFLALGSGVGTSVTATTTETAIASVPLTGRVAVGDTLRLRAGWTQLVTAGTITCQYRVKVAGTAIASNNASPITISATARNGILDVSLRVVSLTSVALTGTISLTNTAASGEFTVQNASGGFGWSIADKTGVTVTNLSTGSPTLELTAQWSTADATNVITPVMYHAERLRS
jgi:hypothetical protein